MQKLLIVHIKTKRKDLLSSFFVYNEIEFDDSNWTLTGFCTEGFLLHKDILVGKNDIAFLKVFSTNKNDIHYLELLLKQWNVLT